MPQTKPIVSIENVVASATVNQTVNLNLITQIFPDVEYHPDQFPGLVFRLRSPKTATLIFSSGKMVCTGAKSEKMAIQAVKSVVLKLKKGGIPLEHEPQIEIQNIVASASLGGKIHLELAEECCRAACTSLNSFPALFTGCWIPRLSYCYLHLVSWCVQELRKKVKYTAQYPTSTRSWKKRT